MHNLGFGVGSIDWSMNILHICICVNGFVAIDFAQAGERCS
jgi:hypothetical protein